MRTELFIVTTQSSQLIYSHVSGGGSFLQGCLVRGIISPTPPPNTLALMLSPTTSFLPRFLSLVFSPIPLAVTSVAQAHDSSLYVPAPLQARVAVLVARVNNSGPST